MSTGVVVSDIIGSRLTTADQVAAIYSSQLCELHQVTKTLTVDSGWHLHFTSACLLQRPALSTTVAAAQQISPTLVQLQWLKAGITGPVIGQPAQRLPADKGVCVTVTVTVGCQSPV